MNKRITRNNEDTRLLSVLELMSYIGVGRNSAIAFGKEHDALIKIGSRTLFDKKIIDKALDQLAGN